MEAWSRRVTGADWEVRSGPRHHVNSKTMCWVTVDRAVRIAENVFGRERPEWPVLRDRIAADIFEHGWDDAANTFTTAYDGTDEQAMDRRMAARPEHIAQAAESKKAGKIIAGGAILGEFDEMIGSTLYVDFESREELDQWLLNDPYVTGGVWKDISVLPIKLAIKP